MSIILILTLEVVKFNKIVLRLIYICSYYLALIIILIETKKYITNSLSNTTNLILYFISTYLVFGVCVLYIATTFVQNGFFHSRQGSKLEVSKYKLTSRGGL